MMNTFCIQQSSCPLLTEECILGIIISDVEGYLAAMHTVIIGTLAKYMLESLNCWLMGSTSACLKYHGVL